MKDINSSFTFNNNNNYIPYNCYNSNTSLTSTLDYTLLSSPESMSQSIKRNSSSPSDISFSTKRASKIRKPNNAMSISSLLSPPKSSNEVLVNHQHLNQHSISLPSLSYSPSSHLHPIGSYHSSPERLSLPFNNFNKPPSTPILPLPPIFHQLSSNDPYYSSLIQPNNKSTSSSASYKKEEYKNTSIECFHSSVAQKSYGNEKRFICPPPIIRAIENNDDNSVPRLSKLNNPVRLSIVTEGDNEDNLQQDSQLEANKSTVFRYLHVNNKNKTKQFQLKLDIFSNDNDEPKHTLLTKPISIVSKPSKSRSLASCILSGSLISLYSRINSQTVRTNYLKVNNGNQLDFSKDEWTPMKIELVNQYSNDLKPRPITYGSHVILKDFDSSIKSEVFEILKVERNQVLTDYQGPVLQMHKIALRKVDSNGLSLLSCEVNKLIYHPNENNYNSNTLINNLSFSSFNSNFNSFKLEDTNIWTLIGISLSKHDI